MPKPSSNIFKKAVMTIGLIAFMVVGYLGMNVATSCKAEAQCICMVCIMPGSYGVGIGIISAATATNIANATAQYLVNLEIKAVAVGKAITTQSRTTKENIVSWFDTFWSYNLRPAMQAMTRQLNARDAWQTQMLGSFQDAMNVNRTHLALMEAQLQSHRDTRVSEKVCTAATVTGGMTSADTFRRAYGMTATVDKNARTSNSALAKTFSSQDEDTLASSGLIKTAEAQRALGAAFGTAADMKDRWQHYLTNYCDALANAKNGGCTKSAPYKNRDLDVTREIFAKPTIDVQDEKTRMVVDDILANLAEPFVPNPVKSAGMTAEAFQEEILKRQSYKAQRQSIYDVLNYVVARRIPGSAGGTKTNFLGEVRQAAGVDPSMISANPSYNEIMQVLMNDRFRTGTTSIDEIDDPENNMREMVIQQAFQAMQMNDTLELLDHYALVLTGQVGRSTNESKSIDSKTKDTAINGN